jgi:MFS superfamily sulfate permease-like transporter
MSTQSRALEDGEGPVSWTARLSLLRREVLVALPFSFSLISICLSSGLLAFSPLGPDYVARGITLGLYAIIFGGICTALVATSSFIIYSPRSNLALIQATAAAHFLGKASFANNPEAVIVALAICVFLAGLLQILFAIGGIARIIKYTPHPVMAGFINGAALAIAWSQIKPFINFHSGEMFPTITHPATLAFIVTMALFIFGVDRTIKRVPAPLVGLIVGVVVFYALGQIVPDLQLGRLIGGLSVEMPPHSPLLELVSPSIADALLSAIPDILFVAFAIAVIATFETLLVYRVAQNLADRPLGSLRDLVALGAGNCASAAVGGIAFSAANGQTRSVFREGGRTRAVPIAIGLFILILITALPGLLAAVPVAVISALLLQNTFQKIDMWSIRLFFHTVRAPPSPERRRAWYDLAVVGTVMAVTVTISVLPGVLAGVLVACVVFIANMSRPIVRRSYTGESVSSKRMRSAEDAAILRQSGSRRIALELHGVLFFGNADDLSNTASKLFADADMIVLDCRGISDIDVSGATILRNLAEKSRKRRKQLLFCNVPAIHAATIAEIVGGPEPQIFPDLDSTLEWMEEKVLQANAASRAKPALLRFEEHDFLQGLEPAEFDVLKPYLTLKELPAGTTLCVEGDEADRMWLLMKGSVSVRLRVADSLAGRRIASCATGTTVGEMAFVEPVRRSASVVTDEETVCYEFERRAFDRILEEHPGIANKLLTNLSRELARRVRRTSEQLRAAVN